jgi:hypothetical protein
MYRVRSSRTSLKSATARPTRVAVEAVEPRTMLTVTLQFDYSFDTGGFFTDPARRAVLQAAATAVTGAMTDFLDAIVPGGSNTMTLSFDDPGTGNPTTVVDPTIPEDVIIVYVGGYDLPGAAVGLGGPAGVSASGSLAFTRTAQARGNNGALGNNPTDFAPAAGAIAFDTLAPFYFNTDASGLTSGDNDFFSIAQHEIAHLLGFPSADSFQRFVQNNHTFTGPKTVAAFGGNPVPLENDDSHFLDGTNVSGVEALMDPTLTIGTRKTITPLDLAALDDLGWSFDPVPPPVVSVTAVEDSAGEPGTMGVLRLSRSGRTSAPLDVSLTFGGTAFRNSDYILTINGTDNNPDNDATFNGTTITIPAGASSITFTLHPVDDDVIEPAETAIVGVGTDPDYTVGSSGTVSLSDDDLVKRQDIREPATPSNVSIDGKTSNLGVFDESQSLSADGRYATFVSRSTNLVVSPLTTFFQVYRRDLIGGTTRIVSLAAGELAEANEDSISAKMSANGRYIAYETNANNILAGDVDSNTATDVYLKDMDTNATSLVTKGKGGELLAISADGEQVLFQSTSSAAFFAKGTVDQNGGNDLFVWNRRTGKYKCLSLNADSSATGNRPTVGNSQVGAASFSGDGRFVVFPSRASDLVAAVSDGNTFQYDLFVRDVAAATTEYVSVSAEPTVGGDKLSGDGELTLDGRYVIFRSSATNLVAGITDINETQDIFLRDRLLGTTKLLSVRRTGNFTGNGGNGVPDITSDGRYAVFTSTSTNVVKGDTNEISDAYLVDTRNGHVELLTVNNLGTNGGGAPTVDVKISDDGSEVVFLTFAPDLPGDFDKADANFAAVYTRDNIIKENSVVSFEAGGIPAGADASHILFSADGTRVGFASASSSIVKPDTNNASDIFTAPVFGHEAARIDANGKLTVYGSTVADSINVQRVNSNITVRRNAQAFTFKASAVTSIDVLASDGDDSIVLGTNLMGTYVSAGNGNDVVRGGGGDDRLQGGPGRDLLYGGAGDDRIDGGKGVDTIFGESGSDRLYGGDSDDLIDGGSGVDRFFGGLGIDTSVKSESSDIIDSIEILA